MNLAAPEPANGDVGSIINGITPNWGPFADLGNTARTVVGALLAAAVLFLFARAIIGAVHIKIGQNQHDTVQVKKGQNELASALTAIFVLGSMITLFTIVYGMAI